jgi:polynucleotide 5'-hydroxyl-kinase GRC3/NOL9
MKYPPIVESSSANLTRPSTGNLIAQKRETLLMEPGSVTMVRGPATVRVEGQCRVLGMDVSDRQVTVRAGKALPFEPFAGCLLDISGEWWLADQSGAGTRIWERVAKKVLSRKKGVVMVVGGSDAGKSTFCVYLSNLALQSGIVPCVIDGDTGQGDLAPPAAMGAAVMAGQVVDLREVKASFFEFVGVLTPTGSERLAATKLRAILGRARPLASLHIVNTDGYIMDGGARYKKMIARTLRPDVVVILGQTGGLAASLAGPWQLLRARSSGQAIKTRQDRVGRRIEQFMRYVGEGSVEKSVKGLQFVYRGRRLSPGRAVHLLAGGMFVGLGSSARVAGFGLVERAGDSIVVRTGLRDFSAVYLSCVGVRDGAEIRF